MIVKLLTERHLEFLSLKGGCRDSSESTHVKMPHCWKSRASAYYLVLFFITGTVTVRLSKRKTETIMSASSSRGLIPKAKIKTIKMTFVIVLGKFRQFEMHHTFNEN